MSASFMTAIAQRTVDAAELASEASIPEFIAWCSAKRITHHPAVQIVVTDGEGLGVIAGGAVAAGEALISVPRRACLSLSNSYEGAAAGIALDQKHALALAAATQPEEMRPWLALWPKLAEGTWALDEAGWKAFSWNRELRRLHDQQEAAARRAFSEVSSAGGDAAPSWETYRWAMSIVSSRAADVVVSGERQPCVVPLLDLLNHRPYGLENGAIRFETSDDGEDRLVVRCVRAVVAGEPLTICYGDKPNSALLHGYGFATRPNPSDTLLLRVPLGAPTDLVSMQRVAMLPSGLLAPPEPSDEARSDEGASESGPAAEGTLGWDRAGRAAWVSPELQMLLRAATAASVPELFAALTSGAAAEDDEETAAADGGDACRKEGAPTCELSPAAWGLLREAAQAALDALDATAKPVAASYWPHVAADVALRARRELLSSALETAQRALS